MGIAYIHNLSQHPFVLHCGSLGTFRIPAASDPLAIESLREEYQIGTRPANLDLALRMIGANLHYSGDTNDMRTFGLIASLDRQLSAGVAERAARRIAVANSPYMLWRARLRRQS